tara:strand:- start:131 stop:400 length:270 start_codon:yes stop_codon:yes gene_type:complete
MQTLTTSQVENLDYYYDKVKIRRELKKRGIKIDYVWAHHIQSFETCWQIMFDDQSCEQMNISNENTVPDVKAMGCKARLIREIQREETI